MKLYILLIFTILLILGVPQLLRIRRENIRDTITVKNESSRVISNIVILHTNVRFETGAMSPGATKSFRFRPQGESAYEVIVFLDAKRRVDFVLGYVSGYQETDRIVINDKNLEFSSLVQFPLEWLWRDSPRPSKSVYSLEDGSLID